MAIPFTAIGTLFAECLKPLANPFTWPILAVVATLGFCKGGDYRDQAWRALIAKERIAQERKLREADERLFAVLERLNRDKEKRDARIAVLLEKLGSTPKLKRGCLSPDVVRAINRALSR